MSRKRNPSQSSDEITRESKKPHLSFSISGLSIWWEWENSGSNWTAFSQDAVDIITSAFNSNAEECTITLEDGTNLRILFNKMVQKNKRTGWERRIRICFIDDNFEDKFTWAWEDKANIWHPYNVSNSIKIEKTLKAGSDTLDLKIGRSNYSVDFSNMKQTHVSSSTSHSIDRIKSVTSIPKFKSTVFDTSSSQNSSKSNVNYKSSAKSTYKSSAKSGFVKVENEEASSFKTVVVKGRSPVDPECIAKQDVAHVYSEGNDVYDIMLNQTNLQNNNNKYYLMQLLKDDVKNSFSVWFRWGRVGFKGQNNLIPCGPDLNEAKNIFTKKFLDKTKNNFNERKSFVKVAGKYDIVSIDYNTEEKDKTTSSDDTFKRPEIPESKLEAGVQSLMQLICDVKYMEESVVEMKYDAKKAPLGKLTESQIKAGYVALRDIDRCISNNDFGQNLIKACDEFYTRIPHYFGMSRPPVIRTKNELKTKLSLLEALADIEIAMKIIKMTVSHENPIDTRYNSLKCDIVTLSKTDEQFKMIESYLQNTHAITHNQYKMEIEEIYCVERLGEKAAFLDVGNRMLLWHGSRLTNWVGILSQGLRVAPAEAPVTGYMFGKGIYFADMSSKSANYCYPSHSSGNSTGIVSLCEVALGDTLDLIASDYNADQNLGDKNSVRGLGKTAPDSNQNISMSGITVPMGKAKVTGIHNTTGYTLNYNEYVVYNPNQIKMKYLIRLKFIFD